MSEPSRSQPASPTITVAAKAKLARETHRPSWTPSADELAARLTNH